MKEVQDVTVDDILRQMIEGALPNALGREASHAERTAARERLESALADNRVLFQCIGCDGPIEPKDAAMCACGGFVCLPCRRVEEEGVCTHERPSFLPAGDGES